jgi:hypothetical protein
VSFEIDNRQILGKLTGLSKAVENKIAKKAVLAGVKMFAKAIKNRLPATQKSARKAIGYSAVRARKGAGKGFLYAKAGGAVGMKEAKRAKTVQKKRGNKPGVGIPANNIHWLLVGTDDRVTGWKTTRDRKTKKIIRRTKTGNTVRFVGRMPKSKAVPQAFKQSQGAVNAVMAGIVAVGIKAAFK